MRLLIDGNNVLHSAMPPPLERLDVARLCRVLAKTPWVREPITLVCDGHPGPLGLLDSPVEATELIWAGRRTADALIIERIDREPSPRRLVVVSTDREIRLAAKERGTWSWTSDEFLTRLAEAVREPDRPPPDRDVKPTPEALSDADVQQWLDDFGLGD